TLLNVPEIVDGVMPYPNYLSEESTLSPRHRELLILRVAWLCGSDQLWATHAARARSAGLSDTEIKRIAQGPDAEGWDPFEATLLRLTDQSRRAAFPRLCSRRDGDRPEKLQPRWMFGGHAEGLFERKTGAGERAFLEKPPDQRDPVRHPARR